MGVHKVTLPFIVTGETLKSVSFTAALYSYSSDFHLPPQSKQGGECGREISSNWTRLVHSISDFPKHGLASHTVQRKGSLFHTVLHSYSHVGLGRYLPRHVVLCNLKKKPSPVLSFVNCCVSIVSKCQVIRQQKEMKRRGAQKLHLNQLKHLLTPQCKTN